VAITIDELLSDLEKSKSENKTLLAMTTNVINRKMRLRFFIISRFFSLGILTSRLFVNKKNIFANIR
jgi:hypothetical protein